MTHSYPEWFREKIFLIYPKESEIGEALAKGKNIKPLLKKDLSRKDIPKKDVQYLISQLTLFRKFLL